MMNTKLALASGAAAIAVIGIGVFAVLSLSGGDGEATTEALVAAVIAQADTSDTIPEPTQAQKTFQSLAVDANAPECRVPRPPATLASKAYVRNGYTAILTIMAMERWQKSGSCECFLEQITWDEAVAESKNYETSETPIPPFNVGLLQETADDMIAKRQKVCGG